MILLWPGAPDGLFQEHCSRHSDDFNGCDQLGDSIRAGVVDEIPQSTGGSRHRVGSRLAVAELVSFVASAFRRVRARILVGVSQGTSVIAVIAEKCLLFAYPDLNRPTEARYRRL